MGLWWQFGPIPIEITALAIVGGNKIIYFSLGRMTHASYMFGALGESEVFAVWFENKRL